MRGARGLERDGPRILIKRVRFDLGDGGCGGDNWQLDPDRHLLELYNATRNAGSPPRSRAALDGETHATLKAC